MSFIEDNNVRGLNIYYETISFRVKEDQIYDLKEMCMLVWQILHTTRPYQLGISLNGKFNSIFFKFQEIKGNLNITQRKGKGFYWLFDNHMEIRSQEFLKTVAVLVLLYGCNTLIVRKGLDGKLDGNYTIMLRALLNKSRHQHLTIQQLYDHLPPISMTIQIRRARYSDTTQEVRKK